MVKKKGKSKRITLKDKFKIKKRTTETHRKIRKQAKRDTKNGVVRNEKKPKDPGIPNSWPFKQDLLNEIAKAREQASLSTKDKKNKKNNSIVSNLVPVKTLEEFMAMAQSNRVDFDSKTGNVDLSSSANTNTMKEQGSNNNNNNNNNSTNPTQTTKRSNKTLYGQQSRRAYLRDLGKVVDASDVILQILDARDPLGTRIHAAVENVILANVDKKMVFVLNKIDLIPKAAVSGWLTYLRRSHPTIAMKCGTNPQGSKDHIGRTQGDSALDSSCGVGVENLLNLLKNYSRSSFNNKKKKTCISVGIIGYPNVGKSSVLNTLKRCRAVGVSPRPGFTTSLQEVVLDKNIRLIDSPGVVFDEYDDEKKDTASLFLKNCIDVDSMEDPILGVEALLNRCTLNSLIMTYNIPAFPQGNTMMFLAMVAKQYGKVLKGGIPDKVSAARAVLRDWNSGKIPYYTPPPAMSSSLSTSSSVDSRSSKQMESNGNIQILSDFSPEFDIEKMDAEVLKSLDEREEMDFVCMESVDNRNNKKGPSEEWIRHQMTNADEEDEDEVMSDEGEDMDDPQEEEDEDDEDDDDDDSDEGEEDDDDVEMEEVKQSAKSKKTFHGRNNADLEDYF